MTSAPATKLDASPSEPCPSCTSNAMDEIFSHLGQIVINYMGDIIDVQSAGGHIGCHQHLELALLKSTERPISLRLRTVAVDHGR